MHKPLPQNSLFLRQDMLSNVEERMVQGMTETIDVYYQGYHIDTKTFDEFFVIARDGETIFWFTENEEPRGYAEVYIVTGRGTTTIKSAVRSWKLIIDAITAGEKKHAGLIVTGRTVEFINTDYRFVGRFSGQPLGTVAEVLSLDVIGRLIQEHKQKTKESEQE